MSVAFSMATPVMISSGPSAACDNILYLFCSKCINFMLTVIRMNISGRSQAALGPKLIMTGVAIEKATDIKFFLHITALLIAVSCEKAIRIWNSLQNSILPKICVVLCVKPYSRNINFTPP